MKSLRPLVKRAMNYFGPVNVKDIQYGELEDFLLGQEGLSGKTKHNLKSALHDFFQWLVKRRVIRQDQFPEFPEIAFELGWRKTVDKATQELILEEVHKRTWKSNPRIYISLHSDLVVP